MRKALKILGVILTASVLCSCTRIPDYSEPEDSSLDESSEEESSEELSSELSVKEFEVTQRDFIIKLNAEGGSFNGVEKTDGSFDGNGYVHLKKGNGLVHIVSVNMPQHYRIVLAARSEEGAAVTMTIKGKTCGAFYIPKYEPPKDGGTSSDSAESDAYPFGFYELDNLYLPSGQTILKFYTDNGSFDLDYIVVESSEPVSGDCYNSGTSCANPTASLTTVGVMKYLSDVYGKHTLTAQNTVFGANTEINAVYGAVGRYPAVRVCEMSDEFAKNDRAEKELAAASEWKAGGGLVSYVWHWYSPNDVHGTTVKSMDISGLFGQQLPEELAKSSEDDFDRMIKAGLITNDLKLIAEDIDKAAEFIGKLGEEDITVLFEPIPDPDTGLYWWGTDAKSYRQLWQFMFYRLCSTHSLKNLIWVWNGSSPDYYPGGDYVDIVGQSFYEKSANSFAGRFSALSDSLPSRKPLCVTSCDVLPNVDYMNRDNAIWLWTAAGGGTYTVNGAGALSEDYNRAAYLQYFYNTDIAVTRDELPDFSNYLYGE